MNIYERKLQKHREHLQKVMKFLKLAAITVIVMASYLWFKVDGTPTAELGTHTKPKITTGRVEYPVAVAQPSTDGNSVQDKQEIKKIEGADDPWHSRSNFEKVEQWKVSRGYYSSEDLAMYKTYTRETIEQLAQGGDIKAIYTLVDLKVANGATQQEAIDLYMRAAMLGSSQALDWAGMMATTDRNMMKFQGPNGDELYKKEMIEALSIYEVALIRGDREVMERVIETRSKVDLTDDDLEYIEKRGREIYSKLEDERKSLGLGPFDNTVPEIVKNYQDEALNGFKTFIDN